MPRAIILGLAAAIVFVIVAALMLSVFPAPLKDSDYLVIGSVATLVALAVIFLALISTTLKSKNIFFTRRKK